MAMQKLSNAAKHLSYSVLTVILFIIGVLAIIIITPIIVVSYAYTQLKIRSRELRKKPKDTL
jgi:hypothetical protein